ncbi:hypothetical protein AJ87_39325 [Rhizobium yanglingense]|nr:hypothetical protein AJ87_39325 [Rhizobium yanglingense]
MRFETRAFGQWAVAPQRRFMVELSSHLNFQKPLGVMLAFERLAERGDAIQLKQAAVCRNDAQHDNRDEIGQARKQL